MPERKARITYEQPAPVAAASAPQAFDEGIFATAARAFNEVQSLHGLHRALGETISAIYRVECFWLAAQTRVGRDLAMTVIPCAAWPRVRRHLIAGWRQRREAIRWPAGTERYLARRVIILLRRLRGKSQRERMLPDPELLDATFSLIQQRASMIHLELTDFESYQTCLAGERQADCEAFRNRVAELGRRPALVDIALVAGYADRTQIDRWLAGQRLAAAGANFERVFRLSTSEFLALLASKKRLS